MKSGIKDAPALVFKSDDGNSRTTIQYGNLGEPFREFVEIEQLRLCDGLQVWSRLDRREVTKLRDKLNEFLGEHHENLFRS